MASINEKEEKVKSSVFVTRLIPKEGLEVLKNSFKVKVYRGKTPISREKLLLEVEKVDALLPLLTDRIDREILERGKNLKVVANYAVGYDNIDVDSATELGIAVTNTQVSSQRQRLS